MMKRLYQVFLVLLLLPLSVTAQIITAAPSDFTVDDEVTITYNASLGNKELQGEQGPTYVMTGVVDEVGAREWKNVQGKIGSTEERLRLVPLADDQYQIKIRPRDFYGLTEEDSPAALAFVFYNADGMKLGKTADGTAIFLPVTAAEKEISSFSPRHYQSHQLKGNELVVNTDEGKILVQAYADGITRVSLSNDTHQPNANSYSVVLEPQSIPAQVMDRPKYLLYDTPGTDVYIRKSPLQLKFIQKRDTILSEEAGFYVADEWVGARFKVKPGEALYGAGSRALPYNRRGRELKIRNEAHYGYTLGDPVLEKGMQSRQVVLPSGSWLNYWTGKSYAGLQIISVPTPLERMPLFVRSGSFIPMVNARSSLDQYRTDTLQLRYYASGAPGSSNYTLYLDNGRSTEGDAYELLNFTAYNRVGGGLDLVVAKEGPGYAEAPEQRLLQWQVIGATEAPKKVSWNGEALVLVENKEQLVPGSAWYDAEASQLQAWVLYEGAGGSLQIMGLRTDKPLAGASTGIPPRDQLLPLAPPTSTELGLSRPRQYVTGIVNIPFEVPEQGDYTLEIRNAVGRTVFIEPFYGMAPGQYAVSFSGRDSRQRKLPGGTYTVVLTGKQGQKSAQLQLR